MREKLLKWLKDKRAASGLWGVIAIILTIALGVVVVGLAFNAISGITLPDTWNSTLSNVETVTSSVFGLMPIIALVAVIGFVVAYFAKLS